jgi:uncharacterized membrane protein
MAIALTLSTYTLIGIICYFHSIKKESKVLRVYALILISLILTRLFLVELWRMEISARILTFFAVGLLLVSTAFFSKKRKTEKTEKTEE